MTIKILGKISLITMDPLAQLTKETQ
jgi:hypothetical protein